jgi:hypothetical protein
MSYKGKNFYEYGRRKFVKFLKNSELSIPITKSKSFFTKLLSILLTLLNLGHIHKTMNLRNKLECLSLETSLA